jgi:hypothetical protein
MFKNRFILVIGVISLLLVTIAVSKPLSNASPASLAGANDFYQRHPDWTWVNIQNAVIPATGNRDLSDYALRHPELSASPDALIDTSDYFLRHPDLSVAIDTAIDTSDYFLRHPELSVSTGTAIDTSDYFLRHPELSASVKSVDTSDYFLRHPEFK